MNKLEKSNHSLVLPISESQFKDFLQSLLGKPQTISKDFPGNFSLERTDIININKLLSQRINQQNKGQLVLFSATIYYNDNSTIELHGIEHLMDYTETLPLICEAIHLTWKFLVKFEDKESPEIQEINISFITDISNQKKYNFQDDLLNPFYYKSSSINLRIKHTARTWGVDIEGLLSRHIKTITTQKSKLDKALRIRFFSQDSIISIMIMLVTSITLLLSIGGVEEGIKGLLFIISLYFLLNLCNQIWDNFINNSFFKGNYILLNAESIKNKERSEKKYKNSIIKSIIYYFSQIAIGVIGNMVFNNFFQ